MLARSASSEAAESSGASSRVALAVLGVMLLAGLWVRFNNRIATILPALAAPGSAASVTPSGLIELASLPSDDKAAAVAGMGLPSVQAGLLAEAVRRGRLRLVRLPLFDAQPDQGAAPRVVRVSAGGYATTVALGAQPVPVTLPVGPVGSIVLSAGGAGAVAVGALTLDGPVRLPDLAAGQVLKVGVIAQ